MAKIEYMQSTFCSDLKPRARLVLQCLILHSNKEGDVYKRQPMNTAQAPAFRQAIWNTSAGILRSWSARRGCGTWGNRTSQ